jgi:hypothetical protein
VHLLVKVTQQIRIILWGNGFSCGVMQAPAPIQYLSLGATSNGGGVLDPTTPPRSLMEAFFLLNCRKLNSVSSPVWEFYVSVMAWQQYQHSSWTPLAGGEGDFGLASPPLYGEGTSYYGSSGYRSDRQDRPLFTSDNESYELDE